MGLWKVFCVGKKKTKNSMQIIKIENINLVELVEELKKGKTVVYPTETCYGLGCDSTNAQAVAKIFAIKKRQKDKPVLALVPEVGMVMQYIEWSPSLEKISQRYWPGPLTVVVPIRFVKNLAPGVVAENGTIAFRVTGHPLCISLAKELGVPLVSTSANISSEASPYDIESVVAMFCDKELRPDIIIDAGVLVHHNPSTIIKVTGEKIEVLRQGEVIIEE